MDRTIVMMSAERCTGLKESFAPEVAGVLRVAGSRVLRVCRISAQGPAASGECLASGNHRFGSFAFLYPFNHRREHVEVIERRSAAAVSHAGNEKHAAPFSHLVCSAIRCGK